MSNGTGDPPGATGEPQGGAPPGGLPGGGADVALDWLPVLDPKTAPHLGEVNLRPRAALLDRGKILLLLVALWWVLVWANSTNNPIEPFNVVIGHELTSLSWLEALAGLELLRQIHYLISEHSARWHRLWSRGIFGGLSRLTGRIGDWNRYRIGRVVRVLVFLAMLAIILGALYHVSPVVSLFQVPATIYTALPFVAQLAFAFFFVAFQFIGLFWLLSRGGVDVYYPGDVKTRFSDVWGQDAVLQRVKENIIFLKDPESIEARGGYVPGGILLWGPPGTGKTLIAEAVAGETQNPFVFVDPGAFINMFMGVGILKVKSLFRKLRKLALRYGGVVVFFDEADSLGNRGALTPGGDIRGQQLRAGRSLVDDHLQRRLLPRPRVDPRAVRPTDAAGCLRARPAPGHLPHDGRGDDGGGRDGDPAVAALGDLRAEQAAGPRQPRPPPAARDAAETTAEVPHAHHDGDEHAAIAGRGAATAGPYRPHLQGRLSVQGGQDPHLRGLSRQGRRTS